MNHPHVRLLGVAVALTAVLGACNGSTSSPTTTPTSPDGSQQSERATPQPSGDGDRKVIASTGDPASEAGGLEIYSLSRDSRQLVTLRFALVNKGTKNVSVANRFGGLGSRNVSETYLVDPDGLKKYLTVLDANGSCVCSRDLFEVKPGERLDLFATFAAPPPEVKAVTVVVPSFHPLSGIRLS